jgi:hypothetical protein
MTSNIDWFTKYDTLFNVKHNLCDGIGKNIVTIWTNMCQMVEVNNVLHVLLLIKNLLFMCQSTQKEDVFLFTIIFVQSNFAPNGDLIPFKCAQINNLYHVGTWINVSSLSIAQLLLCSNLQETLRWHYKVAILMSIP